MYKEFYENFVPGDSGYSSMPQLILICEDDKHTAEAFREIVTNKVEIPQIKLYFTTDLRQNEETLENTLIEFKIDEKTNKYKMFNVEAKILGIQSKTQTFKKRKQRMFGHRADGKKVKNLEPIFRILPSVMIDRSDAQVYFKQDIPLSNMDEYIDKKAQDGIRMSYMNIIYAGIVR